MNIIAIPIGPDTKPADIRALFEQRGLSAGDRLKVDLGRNASAHLLIVSVIIALGIYFNRKKETDRLLKGIFEKYQSVEELEAEVKREYGVQLEVTSSAEEDWSDIGARQLGEVLEDEEDISHMVVKGGGSPFGG